MNEQAKLYSLFEKEALPHIDALYNFALRMTGNKKEAGSLLYKTFSKAYWFFDKLERDTDYKIWLFRIIKNTYSDSYSKKSNEQDENHNEIETLYTTIKDSLPDNFSLEKEIYNNLNDKEINEALSSLPEDLKMVIILCDIEDFSYEQIADLIDIPIGTLISRLYRGRKMFFLKLYQFAEEKG
jgi:RNA polymerase sigma-70 factor (ECF subfamily)